MADTIRTAAGGSMTTMDHFNWPMPQRKDLMSLSTLGRMDVPRVKTAHVERRVRAESKNLATGDIQGMYFVHSKFISQ